MVILELIHEQVFQPQLADGRIAFISTRPMILIHLEPCSVISVAV